MAHYSDLSIDGTSKAVVSNDGFVEVGSSGIQTTEIKDSAVVNEDALNKMATSIPTPFARLYLYDTAFAELNALESKDENKGLIYKSKGSDASLYHHLVAECLDLLEFIFEYGEDSRFSIHEWDVITDTASLGVTSATLDGRLILEEEDYGGVRKRKDPVEKKHSKLGTALRDAILNTSLRSANKIFIFKWDGEIIGGTSPFTLVYTGPNWRRKMAAKGWKFYGGKGNILFPQIEPASRIWSLAERSDEFRLYMYALADMYNAQFSLNKTDGGQLSNLYNYLQNTLNGYESTPAGITHVYEIYTKIVSLDLKAYFAGHFKDLKLTSKAAGDAGAQTKVMAGAIPFFTKVMKPDSTSAYMVSPTVETLPVEKNVSGVSIDMAENLPLVLSSSSLGERARYWYRTPYNPETLPVKPEESYLERTLPGVPGNPKYPYLTAGDFLEDSIMKLGYMIDSNRFFTGYNGNCEFLLPLKPTFFKYFRVEDLPKMVKVIPEGFPICKSVTVSLEIPVKGGTVNFTRVYEPGKGFRFSDLSKEGGFKLGVFPFYTYAGTEAADEDLYKVLLARMTDVGLEFYNRDFVTPLGNDIVSRKKRTEDGNKVTEYYTLGTPMGEDKSGTPGTFSVIRVVKNGVGGMIVPLFKKASPGSDKYIFSVDFGTANTNVAYALETTFPTSDGLELRVDGNSIRTLEYGPESFQMAMLNEEGSEGTAIELNPLIDQEFIPKAIGEGRVKFPIRTRVCSRHNQTNGDSELFGDVNVAFHIDKYRDQKATNSESKGKLYSYDTKLKWSHNHKVKKLTKAFFQELLWICKNKVAELGGDPQFDFFFTYPQTMQNTVSLMRGWKEAAESIRTHARIFNENIRSANGRRLNLYEGIAPWYRAVSQKAGNVFYNDEFLNVDIGGGSTDVVFIQSPVRDSLREMKGYSFSAKFAADDLWGDGVSGKNHTSGFLAFFEKEVKPLLDSIKQTEYEAYDSQTQPSQDMIGYIFSNHGTVFTEQLVGNEHMRLPMLVHFAATFYYIGRTLAMAQLQMPKHIYFSGMGSLYVKYLTEDTDVLADIIKAIFKFCGLKLEDKNGREKALNVGFTKDPKKVTAEGALLMVNTTKPELTDKVVRSEELNYHLYNGEEDEEEEIEMTLSKVDEYKDPVYEEVNRFVGLFADKTFSKAISNLEGNTPKLDVEEFLTWAEKGFDDSKAHEYPSGQNETPIKDVLFFWPLKHALYMLGNKMADLSASSLSGNSNRYS